MWLAAYQPARSRILRFVFPLPDEPMITECRAKERAGTVSMGRHLCRMARMTGPITTCPLPVRRGTVPGAAGPSVASLHGLMALPPTGTGRDAAGRRKREMAGRRRWS